MILDIGHALGGPTDLHTLGAVGGRTLVAVLRPGTIAYTVARDLDCPTRVEVAREVRVGGFAATAGAELRTDVWRRLREAGRVAYRGERATVDGRDCPVWEVVG